MLLGVDEEMRSVWRDCRDNIASYPLRSDSGALYWSTMPPSLRNDKPAWAQGKEPAYRAGVLDSIESPIFKMLEKYDVLNLETRDQHLDNGDFETALNTYYQSPGYYKQVMNQEIDRNGSSRFHVDAAKLGRAEDLERILSAQYGVFSTYGEQPNLLFDQLDYYSIEGYGTFVAAIQNGLHQSLSPTPTADPVIRVFPAWPRKWDAKFKLLAKDGFLVSSSIESETIQYIEIESLLGNVCSIRNPWDTGIVLYRNGIMAETVNALSNDLLSFPTHKNEILVIVSIDTNACLPSLH